MSLSLSLDLLLINKIMSGEQISTVNMINGIEIKALTNFQSSNDRMVNWLN